MTFTGRSSSPTLDPGESEISSVDIAGKEKKVEPKDPYLSQLRARPLDENGIAGLVCFAIHDLFLILYLFIIFLVFTVPRREMSVELIDAGLIADNEREK